MVGVGIVMNQEAGTPAIENSLTKGVVGIHTAGLTYLYDEGTAAARDFYIVDFVFGPSSKLAQLISALPRIDCVHLRLDISSNIAMAF